jgi:hypothetical protein
LIRFYFSFPATLHSIDHHQPSHIFLIDALN